MNTWWLMLISHSDLGVLSAWLRIEARVVRPVNWFSGEHLVREHAEGERIALRADDDLPGALR